jgi:F0F1-type ATP synthase assembly protein I
MKKTQLDKKKYDWSGGWNLFSRLSAWIAFPVLGAMLVGKWLDTRWKTEPWGLLICIAVAFVISIARMISIALKELEKESLAKKEKNRLCQNLSHK